MKGEEKMEKAMLASDYQEGAHPGIMRRLLETNLLQTPGYGADEFSESARRKIREACGAPEAAVHFLTGGTQANAVVIDSLLRSYEGVIPPQAAMSACTRREPSSTAATRFSSSRSMRGKSTPVSSGNTAEPSLMTATAITW
jgi:hypothetical protein